MSSAETRNVQYMENQKNLNNELKLKLRNLKTDAGYKYIMQQVGHWRNQCLNEILQPGEHQEAKGEFKAYGRLINSVDAFIEQLETNPGEIINLDPNA